MIIIHCEDHFFKNIEKHVYSTTDIVNKNIFDGYTTLSTFFEY